jgi:hypothetical protein
MERKTGAQLFVMAAFQKPDGTVSTTKYEISKLERILHFSLIISSRFQTPSRVGDPFISAFPNWKQKTWDSWELYVQDHYSALCCFNKLNDFNHAL